MNLSTPAHTFAHNLNLMAMAYATKLEQDICFAQEKVAETQNLFMASIGGDRASFCDAQRKLQEATQELRKTQSAYNAWLSAGKEKT